jgi:4-alpha-glucanotransferase
VQWHLHLQLKAAVDYAHSQGLALKGDLPIGIYRDSADAWVAPELYNMNVQAGAPPDPFAEKGQNWGFPTYEWSRMKADGFAWWKQRFEQMSLYFDAFRIDHILGFFRIWSIPDHAIEGILGYFSPALPLTEKELRERGVGFSYDRLCKPYISAQVLGELFQDKAAWVAQNCLSQRPDGRFDLLPAFDTQRKVAAYFDAQPPSDTNARLKQGLFDLITNVILLGEPAAEGKEWEGAFRFDMEKTSSFQFLPQEVQGTLKSLYINYFYQRQDDFWEQQAMEKLPALKRSTNMLICGEDLGLVPACVPGVMRTLGLLSLEIQRMPKAPGTAFLHPKEAPYLSVITPGTHDMSVLRGWWEENRELSQRFYNEILGQQGSAPYFCEPWVVRNIIAQHFQSPAMWAIFQLQDLLGMDGALRRENPHDERINIPANPKHYWRYRSHLSLENLLKADAFNEDIRRMVRESGRN